MLLQNDVELTATCSSELGLHDIVARVNILPGIPAYGVGGPWENSSPAECAEICDLLSVEVVYGRRSRTLNLKKISKRTKEQIEEALYEAYEKEINAERESAGYYD